MPFISSYMFCNIKEYMILYIIMDNGIAFKKGIRDGIPIGMGYFAVAFSLGFMAKKCGLSPLQGFIGSFFTRASAGEYGVYTMVVQDAGYLSVVGSVVGGLCCKNNALVVVG